MFKNPIRQGVQLIGHYLHLYVFVIRLGLTSCERRQVRQMLTQTKKMFKQNKNKISVLDLKQTSVNDSNQHITFVNSNSVYQSLSVNQIQWIYFHFKTVQNHMKTIKS